MRNLLLMVTLLVVACNPVKKKLEASEPSAADIAAYQDASAAVADRFIYGGFGVVSLDPSGAPEHLGEALIWGGTYLWGVSCDLGKPVADALAAMINRLGGQMIRVDPLGEYEGDRAITWDGMVGALMGISRRVTACGETDLWRQPILAMIAYQDSRGHRLNDSSSAVAPVGFLYVRDLIAARLGLRDEPDESRKIDFEKNAAGWPAIVALSHQTGIGSDACFRVNLAFSSIVTVETLGKEMSDAARGEFCLGSDGMQIPTIDHLCGRERISNYIAQFEPNQWEYRHQRCGSWESPDGGGNQSPGLDRLTAYVMEFGFESLQEH